MKRLYCFLGLTLLYRSVTFTTGWESAEDHLSTTVLGGGLYLGMR